MPEIDPYIDFWHPADFKFIDPCMGSFVGRKSDQHKKAGVKRSGFPKFAERQ